MGDTEFTTDQVDTAIDHVIDNGACNNGSSIHYSLVFAAADLAAPQELHQGGESRVVSNFMERSTTSASSGGYRRWTHWWCTLLAPGRGSPAAATSGSTTCRTLRPAHPTGTSRRGDTLLGRAEAELHNLGHPTTSRPGLTHASPRHPLLPMSEHGKTCWGR
jgi:hypothetical protein